MVLPFAAALALLAIPFAAAGCGTCDAMYISSFSVHVLDLKTGGDLAGVSLTFDHGDTFTATTDTKGFYYGPNNADSGDWSVTATSSGYRTQTVAFEVESRGCHNDGPDLTIALAPVP